MVRVAGPVPSHPCNFTNADAPGGLVSLAQALEGLQAPQVMLMLLINRCPGENHWSELEGGSRECGGRGRRPGLQKKLNVRRRRASRGGGGWELLGEGAVDGGGGYNGKSPWGAVGSGERARWEGRKGRVGNGRRKDTGSRGELWPDPERQSEALRLVSGAPSGTLSPRHSPSLVQLPRKAV